MFVSIVVFDIAVSIVIFDVVVFDVFVIVSHGGAVFSCHVDVGRLVFID